jgi:iron complex outermembrane receptor protein
MNKVVNKSTKQQRALSVAICGAILTLSGQALAQQSGGGYMLEEVLVTAQKRSQSLTDVPISIASMGAEKIEQAAIRELREMADYIPNVEIGGGSGGDGVVTIRGVGSSSRNIGFDSRVGVYIDGVYLGQSPATNQDILDLERIEVLRGPQGNLFGKNAEAGAISLITKKPSEEFEAKVLFGTGNYDSKRARASLNLPLGEKVFTRLAVNVQKRDGYADNLGTGDKIGDQDGVSFRGQLRAFLTDSLEMNIALDSLHTDVNPYNSRFIGTQGGLIEPKSQPFEAQNNILPTSERKIEGAAVTFDWALSNGFNTKSITAYRYTKFDRIGDLDAGYAWAGDLEFLFGINSETETHFDDEYSQFSQELQLISPSGEALEYVVGLYFYDQQAETDRASIGHHDPEHPFYASGLLPLPGDGFVINGTYGSVDTTSYAAYFSGTYELTDKLSLGFGGRYSVEKKEVDWTSDDGDNFPDIVGVGIPGLGSGVFGFPQATLVDSREKTHFNPEASLRYALTENMNVYYRYATGYKSGGYNLDFITQPAFDAGLEFDDETVGAHELGIKGDLFDRRVTFGAAIFQSDYDDYQVQSFVNNPDGLAVVAVLNNAAKVRSEGVELEVEALITEHLKLISSVGLIDVTFEDYPGGSQDEDGNPINLAGNTVGGSAAESFNFGLQYNLPIESLAAEASFRVDYLYTGEKYADTQNNNLEERVLDDGTVLDDYLYSDGTSMVNARIALTAMDDKWSVSLWGRNLTDENETGSFLTVFQSIGRRDSEPRTYGAEFSYSF